MPDPVPPPREWVSWKPCENQLVPQTLQNIKVDVETYLQTIAALSLLPHHVEHAVHQLRALGVVSLGPVVAGPGLPEHEVVGAEERAVGAGVKA